MTGSPPDPAPLTVSPRSGGTPSQRSAYTNPLTIQRQQNCHAPGSHQK